MTDYYWQGHEIKKVALTGGPCAGKTTLITRAQEHFAERGWTVLCVGEVATDMILSGASISSKLDILEFEHFLIEEQLWKEQHYENIAKTISRVSPVLILCDRGTMDPLAYLDNEEQLNEILEKFDMSSSEALACYDGVVHLVTAADGAEYAYNLNNAARKETPEEAREMDVRTLNAWTGHPSLKVVKNNYGSFEEKIEAAINAIARICGMNDDVRKERKFLVRVPAPELFKEVPHRVCQVEQHYNMSDEIEKRIRKQTLDGTSSYSYSEKKYSAGDTVIETQRRITEREYLMALSEFNDGTIIKQRIFFTVHKCLGKLDIFETPNASDVAICEIEENIGSETELPEWLDVICDVTDINAYRNSSISKRGNLLEQREFWMNGSPFTV